MTDKELLRKKTIQNRILFFVIIVLLILWVVSYKMYLDKEREREIGEIIHNAFSDTELETRLNKSQENLSLMDLMNFSESGDTLFISICYFPQDELKLKEIAETMEELKKDKWFDYDYAIIDIWNPRLGMVTSIETNLETMETRSYGWYDEQMDEIQQAENAKEEQEVIYQDENVIIKYAGISGKETEYKINFTIENLSDKTLTVQLRESSVNGVMATVACSIDIAPQKKAIDGASVWGESAKLTPMSAVTNFETKFHIFNDEEPKVSYDTENVIVFDTEE